MIAAKDDGTVEADMSIVIPLHNNLPLTIECYESILACRPEGMNLQIVFVDNGSTDGTVSWLTDREADSLINPKAGVEISVRAFQENRGFAAACNEGFQAADKDIVLFVNNDTVFTPHLLQELCLPLVFGRDVSVVGPVSNFVGGVAQVKCDYQNMEGMRAFAEHVFAKEGGKYDRVGMISGLCMAGRRETFQSLVGYHAPEGQLFDETFYPGMWEDNDLCLRARLKSLHPVVARGAFIHHVGSRTFRALGVASSALEENREKFRAKWAAIFPREHKVVAMLRVKNGIRHIERCLSSLEGWVDEIVVLDTGSTDGTLDVIEDHAVAKGGKVALVDSVTFADQPLQEYQERQFLLEMAQGREPTWIARVDVDETWEPRIKKFLPMLLNPEDPQTLCWRFPFKTFWRGEEKYRVDGVWGQMVPFALFRNIPADRLLDNGHPQGFHCSTTPWFHYQNCSYCGVSMLHYGYSDYEECRRKHEWYVRTDTKKDAAFIGGNGDYSHLVDERELKLLPYIPDNTLSLCMLVGGEKDAKGVRAIMSRLGTTLDQAILVYTGSILPVPGTLKEIARDYPQLEIHPFAWADDFAAARNFGLGMCKGRWILHLDPDEEIDNKAVGAISALIERDAMGYGVTIANLIDDPGKAKEPKIVGQEAVRLFRNDPRLRYANPVHETLDNAILSWPGGFKLAPSGVLITHYGYLSGEAAMVSKLAYYKALNEKWAAGSPDDPRPLYNLAMQALEDGEEDAAMDLLGKASRVNKIGFWQVPLALVEMYLQAAAAFGVDALRQMPTASMYRPAVEETVKLIRSRVKPRIKVLAKNKAAVGEKCG